MRESQGDMERWEGEGDVTARACDRGGSNDDSWK